MVLKCCLKTRIFDNTTIHKQSTSKKSDHYIVIVSSSTITKIHTRVTPPCSLSLIPLYSHNVVHTSFSSGILEPYQKNTILSHYQTKAPTSVKTNLRSLLVDYEKNNYQRGKKKCKNTHIHSSLKTGMILPALKKYHRGIKLQEFDEIMYTERDITTICCMKVM